MTFNRVKVGCTVTFMENLASVASLISLPNTLIWNKITFQLSNSLKLTELVINKRTKGIFKKNFQYSFFYPIYHCLMLRFQELITKERDKFSKILISIAFYKSWTTSPRALGVRVLGMKIFVTLGSKYASVNLFFSVKTLVYQVL